MASSSIDVAGMRRVVSGMEHALDDLLASKSWFSSTLTRYEVWANPTGGWWPAIHWTQEQIPGLRRRLTLAEALENSRPEWPTGVAIIDESAVSTVPPEAAVRAGREAAEGLRDARGVPDEQLIALIEANQDDPYFASGFASAVTAAELARLTVNLSYRREQYDGNRTLEEVDAANAWYGRVVQAMSGTLGTATRATGELALPPGYADSWVAAITASVPGGLDGGSGGFQDHANALGVLLSSGRFDTEFATTVAGGVYDYERAWDEEWGTPLWRPRSSDPSTGYVVADSQGRQVRDPMAGIMLMLARDPIAGQAFFLGGGTESVEIAGQDLQVFARLHYLVTERTWAVDPDNGGALGAALEAATTILRDGGEQGRRSAEIAGATFALIGEKTGDGASGGFLGIGADQGWQMWDGLRPHLARMLAGYGADVYRVVTIGSDDQATEGWSNPGSGVLFDGTMPYGVTLGQSSLDAIVATLGEDQDSFTPFLTGMYQASNLAMSVGMARAMAQQPNAGANFLTGGVSDDVNPAITNGASLIGWALSTGYGGDRVDEAMRKKQAEAIADALSVASSLPFVPEIKPEWLSWSVDQAKDGALDAVRASAPSDSGLTYAELDRGARVDLTRTTLDLLLQNGYLDERSLEGAAERGFVVEPPPATAVIRNADGEPVAFDRSPGSGFDEWLAQSSLTSVLAESVVGVYADQWPVVDQ